MESINTLKGYGKVSDQENQIPSPLSKPSSRKTLIATVSVISLLLILAVVAYTAGAFVRPSPHPPVSSKTLKEVCAVTRYPETCFDALSSSSSLNESDPKLNPVSILELSLRLSSQKVSKLSTSFRSINDMPEEPAVGDCVKLYADAASQLNESISEIEKEKKNGGDWFTKKVVGDVKTWISAAMTDGETCSDGLEEMGTVVGNEIKKEMVTANQMMSVSLAIVSEMKNLFFIFH